MATTTLETDITIMTATDIAALSVSQLKALTSSQWALIVASQLSELSAEKVAVLPLAFISPQALEGISTATLGGSLAAINGLAIQKLSDAQVQALTGEQISALTAKKFANFSPEQLSLLNPDKLSAALLGELSAEQVDAFSATQLAALLNFPSLSAEALSGLTTKNLAGLSAEKINLLNLDRLAALTPSQLNALSSELAGLSTTTLAGLSPETLKGFNANLPANVQIFTVKQIAALTPEKLAAFSIEQLQSITAPQAAVLRASQIAALPPEKATALSSIAIMAIRPQVIKHIDLSLFESSDIAVLTMRQVGQFTATNLAQLTTANASGLTSEQINSMKAKSLESLSPESRAALLPEVQTAYNTRVIDVTPPQAPAFNFGGQDNFVNLPLVSTQATVTISGLEAGATWKYSVDDGSTFVTGTGVSFILPPNIYAPHAIQVIQIDAAANESLEAFNAAQIKAQVAVLAAGTFDAAVANVGFQITMGDYLYTVSNFGLGDSIHFPASNTPTISNSNFSDGIVAIQYVLNPNVVTIQITGLTTQQDSSIYSLQTFKNLFGENSITVGSVANNVVPSFNGSLSGSLATFNIGGSPVLLDGTVQIYDAELSALNNFEGASLTIQQTTPNAQDVFSVVGGVYTDYFQTSDVWFWQGDGESGTDGSVHVGESAVGSYIGGAGSLIISFNWNANQEAVNQVLSSITYSNSAVQTAETISIDWTFSDGFGGEIIGSTSVEILPITLDQTITGGSGNDYLVGGLGNDYIVDSQGDNTLDGGEGNDRLHTNIAYFNGNTWVNGGNGHNTILGGAGNDTIQTASGQDNISGGIGDDLITTTTSEGGSGNDIISGGEGKDTIQSAFGNDSILGDAGDDRITDAGGSNTISGGFGNDTIIVNGYNSGDMQILSGDEGDDRLESGMGNDLVNGGDGNDTLYGNSGADTLIGGLGNDQYYFSYSYDSNLDNVDRLTGEFNDANADLIHLPVINGTLTVIPTQSSGLASSELTEISLNDLLNTETGTLTNKFGFSGTTVAILTTTDSKTFLIIDIQGYGYVDSGTMIIDVTGSTLTSLNTATFVGINFYGTTAHDSITGSDFDDYISGELGNDTLLGLAGNDEILGGDGSDSILGGMGDDTLLGDLGDDYISGDDGNDYIDGYQGNNTLLGGAGDDQISSSSGNSNISGGTGNDTIYAYDGFNTVDAGDGNDYIGLSWWSTTASSFVSAGNGNDTIDGSFGNDTILGDAGDDEIYDYDGNDSIDGGDGNDKISSYEGNKTLSGGLGNDQIFAGTGNDSLLGGEGDDVIDAGSGNDTILGGIGENILTGGEGNDTFVFAANTAAPNATTFDSITDFGLDLDVIDVAYTITIASATATAIVGTAQVASNGVANFAAADDTLAEKIIAIEQAIQLNSLTAGEAAVFISDYDSYIFISDAIVGVGAGDVLIKLPDIVATSLTLNAGNIVAVTSPYSLADFSNSVANILAEDTIYILDTAANIGTNFDSLIIPNLAKIDRIDVLNSTVLALTITQFMTAGVVNVLRENSVAIDATNATLSDVTYFHTHLGKIAQSGLSNLALSTANQFEYEIHDLLSKATNATIVADSPTDFEINSFAKFSANIAIDGITGSYTLNSWNVTTATEISSLLSKTNTTATVMVDANYMSSTQLISISSNVSKVDSITNLQLNVSDFTEQQTADLLNVATNVVVNATGATANEVASLVTYAANINAGGITGEISLTIAQAIALNSKLSPYIGITLTDTTATAANLLAINALTTGAINANTITTLTGTVAELNTLLQSYWSVNLNGLTNLTLTDTGSSTLTTVDANVLSGQTLVIDGSATTSGFNFNGAAETDGRFSVIGGAGADTLHGSYGADTLIGGAGVDSISGGEGADVINGGAGIDTMTGGAGADIFVFDSTDLDTTAGAVTDEITDFVSGTDKIALTIAGDNANFLSNSIPFGTLSNMLSAADTALDGTIKYYFGIVNNGNNDGYLVIDQNGTGYTDVIKLTGVTTAISATDISQTA